MSPTTPNMPGARTFGALLVLLALALSPGIVPAAGPGVETAIYRGELSNARIKAFFRRVADRPVKRLRITSAGGDVEAGIALGYWVFDRGLDVEVEGFCLSSCANYVFPAGAGKLVLPGGVVAWHGNYRHLKETGLWQDDIRPRMEKYGEDATTARNRSFAAVNSLVRREEAFFKHIGVDEYVCWVGKMPPYQAPDYYVLSTEDMARFGIDNVQVPPGYASADFSRSGFNIVYLQLQEDADQRSPGEPAKPVRE